MTPILTLINSTDIKAWLVGEPLESAPAHIANGFPDLAADYASGQIRAVIVSVPDTDIFAADLYTVSDGAVVLKTPAPAP